MNEDFQLGLMRVVIILFITFILFIVSSTVLVNSERIEGENQEILLDDGTADTATRERRQNRVNWLNGSLLVVTILAFLTPVFSAQRKPSPGIVNNTNLPRAYEVEVVYKDSDIAKVVKGSVLSTLHLCQRQSVSAITDEEAIERAKIEFKQSQAGRGLKGDPTTVEVEKPIIIPH